MRVFRYFDAKGGLATLSTRKMRLASPLEFNDPFELTPRVEEVSIELVEERLRADEFVRNYYEQSDRKLSEEESRTEYFSKELPRLLKEALLTKAQWPDSIKWQLVGKFAERFRILCASHNFDSILMWSHYAEKHRGLVLEFETDEFMPGVNLDPFIFNVQYRTSPPVMPALHNGVESFEASMRRVLSTKAIQWSYEEEVRIQFPAPIGIRPSVYAEHEFSPSCIKRIIVGCYNDETSQTYKAVDELADQPHYRHAHVQRAYLHPHDYRLSFADRPARTTA